MPIIDTYWEYRIMIDVDSVVTFYQLKNKIGF